MTPLEIALARQADLTLRCARTCLEMVSTVVECSEQGQINSELAARVREFVETTTAELGPAEKQLRKLLRGRR